MILEEDGAVAALLKGDPAEGGKALPLESLSALGVAAVICPGLGRGAHGRLASAGITALYCEAPTAGEALAQYKAGLLQPVTEAMLEAHDRDRAAGRRGLRGSGHCAEKDAGGHPHGECHRHGPGHGRCCETEGRGHGAGKGRCCHHRGQIQA
jgi:predicted Fe-Mo cluster-binding NifX family protein